MPAKKNSVSKTYDLQKLFDAITSSDAKTILDHINEPKSGRERTVDQIYPEHKHDAMCYALVHNPPVALQLLNARKITEQNFETALSVEAEEKIFIGIFALNKLHSAIVKNLEKIFKLAITKNYSQLFDKLLSLPEIQSLVVQLTNDASQNNTTDYLKRIFDTWPQAVKEKISDIFSIIYNQKNSALLDLVIEKFPDIDFSSEQFSLFLQKLIADKDETTFLAFFSVIKKYEKLFGIVEKILPNLLGAAVQLNLYKITEAFIGEANIYVETVLAVDEEGNNLFHILAKYGDERLFALVITRTPVALLAEALSVQNHNQQTPMQFLQSRENSLFIKLLAEHLKKHLENAIKNNTDKSTLEKFISHWKIIKSHFPIVESTLLEQALENHNADAIELLTPLTNFSTPTLSTLRTFINEYLSANSQLVTPECFLKLPKAAITNIPEDLITKILDSARERVQENVRGIIQQYFPTASLNHLATLYATKLDKHHSISATTLVSLLSQAELTNDFLCDHIVNFITVADERNDARVLLEKLLSTNKYHSYFTKLLNARYGETNQTLLHILINHKCRVALRIIFNADRDAETLLMTENSQHQNPIQLAQNSSELELLVDVLANLKLKESHKPLIQEIVNRHKENIFKPYLTKTCKNLELLKKVKNNSDAFIHHIAYGWVTNTIHDQAKATANYVGSWFGVTTGQPRTVDKIGTPIQQLEQQQQPEKQQPRKSLSPTGYKS